MVDILHRAVGGGDERTRVRGGASRVGDADARATAHRDTVAEMRTTTPESACAGGHASSRVQFWPVRSWPKLWCRSSSTRRKPAAT